MGANPLDVGADIQVIDVIDDEPKCMDWFKRQYPATYKFREFSVETDVQIGGRRIQTHQFPGREWWANEDLGAEAETVEVLGYVHGDNAEIKAEEFYRVCCASGPGLLTLPLRPPRLVRCLRVASTFLKDELGRFTFELSFVVEPLGLGAIVSVIGFANAAQRAATSAVGSVTELFRQRFDALAVPAVARFAGATTINLAGQALDEARRSVSITDKKAYARAEVRARRIRIDANTLAYAGELAYRADSTVFVANQVVSQTNFAAAFVEATNELAKSAEPKEMANAMKVMSAFSGNSASSLIDTDSVVAESDLIEAASALVRRIGLLRWTEALTKIKFPSKAEAVTAKADLVERYETELDTVDDSAVERALRDAMNAAIEYLLSTAIDLLVDIKLWFNKLLPVVVVVYWLYGKVDCD
jgi:hypothetical protein